MIPYQPARGPRAAGRFRHGLSPVLGLIGGIGGGKSEVAALLAARGALVIDADVVGHELLNDPEVFGQIIRRFGPGVQVAEGAQPGRSVAIDRRALGAIVFADPEARHDLESILHPRMRDRFSHVIEREATASLTGGRLVVLDAAILLEAGWDDLCDLVVYVDAPREERLARVERTRGWTRAVFDAREQAQWPCDRKRDLADVVITNDAGIEPLRREVERLVERVAELSCPVVEAPRR